MSGYWYLGSPYSSFMPDQSRAVGLATAHAIVCSEAAALIVNGLPVYSPIAHTHPIALYGAQNPLDHDIWLPADRPLMDAAVGLIVLRMEGWERSRGLQYEIDTFKEACKPIVHMAVGDALHVIDLIRRAR